MLGRAASNAARAVAAGGVTFGAPLVQGAAGYLQGLPDAAGAGVKMQWWLDGQAVPAEVLNGDMTGSLLADAVEGAVDQFGFVALYGGEGAAVPEPNPTPSPLQGSQMRDELERGKERLVQGVSDAVAGLGIGKKSWEEVIESVADKPPQQPQVVARFPETADDKQGTALIVSKSKAPLPEPTVAEVQTTNLKRPMHLGAFALPTIPFPIIALYALMPPKVPSTSQAIVPRLPTALAKTRIQPEQPFQLVTVSQPNRGGDSAKTSTVYWLSEAHMRAMVEQIVRTELTPDESAWVARQFERLGAATQTLVMEMIEEVLQGDYDQSRLMILDTPPVAEEIVATPLAVERQVPPFVPQAHAAVYRAPSSPVGGMDIVSTAADSSTSYTLEILGEEQSATHSQAVVVQPPAQGNRVVSTTHRQLVDTFNTLSRGKLPYRTLRDTPVTLTFNTQLLHGIAEAMNEMGAANRKYLEDALSTGKTVPSEQFDHSAYATPHNNSGNTWRYAHVSDITQLPDKDPDSSETARWTPTLPDILEESEFGVSPLPSPVVPVPGGEPEPDEEMTPKHTSGTHPFDMEALYQEIVSSYREDEKQFRDGTLSSDSSAKKGIAKSRFKWTPRPAFENRAGYDEITYHSKGTESLQVNEFVAGEYTHPNLPKKDKQVAGVAESSLVNECKVSLSESALDNGDKTQRIRLLTKTPNFNPKIIQSGIRQLLKQGNQTIRFNLHNIPEPEQHKIQVEITQIYAKERSNWLELHKDAKLAETPEINFNQSPAKAFDPSKIRP